MMAIIGFILSLFILTYLLGVCLIVFAGVSFSIGMGGGKRWHYVYPLVGLIVVGWLFIVLFKYCPFVTATS